MGIKYQKKLFDTIKELSNYNNSIIFRSDANGGSVSRFHTEGNMMFLVDFPNSLFEHGQSELGIYNYAEYYQFFKLFTSPEIEISRFNISFKENTSKATYVLRNTESLGKDPERKTWQNGSLKFVVTAKDLDNIIKASSLISTSDDKKKKIRLYGNLDEVNVELVNQNLNPQNNVYDKTYCKQFKPEPLSSEEINYDFLINAAFFTGAPKRDYEIELKPRGVVKASFKDDEISVSIIASAIVDI